MKEILIIIAFLFVMPLAAQKNVAKLYFNDGTEKTGLAKITYKNEIKFREENGGKKEIYNSDGIKCIEIFNIYEKPRKKTYCYKKINENNPILLRQVINGKLSLYVLDTTTHGSMAGPNGSVFMTGNSSSSYYVCKGDDEIVTHLGDRGNLFSKNFIKAASEYFKDCPELVKKIEDKAYKKRDIEEVVNFYNKDCK
ncbi:hypothetical protein JBL43_09895 [Aureibaculum sp. A20]|uniref:Uncharacterized protein n=1 Tax=Aureibaculum flavum TaxID=2795986 RepID=A0ABS0WRF0_9FLAO|nr:hypothetical protein [Aureibaculum flavum]MBJ2174550.1 hypothetical protein [Aureibaculum flavum]